MRAIDDATFVREQYADEANLAARKSAYANMEGPDPRAVLWELVVAAQPKRVLEVGGGEGELAERIVRALGCELVAIDQSERMVEIQRSKGIDARVGDVQSLPFDDAKFDLAIAAWMLYHVADLDRALSELARVLRPGGRLIAVTNASDHLLELHELAGVAKRDREWVFRSENGEALLRRYFAQVERHDADGWVTMDDATLRAYAKSWNLLTPILELPRQQPLRIRRRPTVFVAETA
jgi:ubiquinone/menaquinone biosynthesis C-methylase UbiE